jgi:hypothetical protein
LVWSVHWGPSNGTVGESAFQLGTANLNTRDIDPAIVDPVSIPA